MYIYTYIYKMFIHTYTYTYVFPYIRSARTPLQTHHAHLAPSANIGEARS